MVSIYGIDLAEARELVRIGDYEILDMLYDDIPDTLSQLIRTAFIARPGYKFIVSDYSAIEARVLAHLADETWRSQVFAEGKDIYCASASQMFGIPIEKHGINSHLRQKGKTAELTLGYGGPVTYEGIGSTKKWERIESYGPKFVENIVQAVSRDLLCYAIHTLSDRKIWGHVHDELIIECPETTDVNSITSVMDKSPDWMPDILIKGDEYEIKFYKKD